MPGLPVTSFTAGVAAIGLVGLSLLALLEAAASHPAVLWPVAGLLLFGRLLHACGMFSNSTPLRGAGMLATFGSLLIAAAVLAAQVAFA